MTTYMCPACGYDELNDPPRTPSGEASYEICSSCGFESGYTDDVQGFDYATWRGQWVDGGMAWWAAIADEDPPVDWDPARQLTNLPGPDAPR